MDHTEEHPESGRRVLLTLKAADPLGVLFDRMIVEVTDWQDRFTGLGWRRRTSPHPLHLDYLRRMAPEGDIVEDPQVVCVWVDQRTGHRLVHESELGTRL